MAEDLVLRRRRPPDPETYPQRGALPEVRAGSLDEDLARRDFTVNAIAIALHAPELGTLHAYPGALDDLEAGTLRVMHAGSFLDDPTRLLRLVPVRGPPGVRGGHANRCAGPRRHRSRRPRRSVRGRVGGELAPSRGRAHALWEG